MLRHKISRSKSRRMFKKGGSKTRAINVSTPRGGIRL